MKQNTILYVIILGLVMALAFIYVNNETGVVLEAAHAESNAELVQARQVKQPIKMPQKKHEQSDSDGDIKQHESVGKGLVKQEKLPENRRHQDCEQCPMIVAIPEGSFYMGSDDGEVNEKPVHSVDVDGFYISETEVTFNQWQACFDDGGCSHLPDDNGWGRGNRPVINVSWGDTQEYMRWLRKKTGIRYRLPSEAEWEYAALAGSQKQYAMGDEISCEQAKYGAFSGDCTGTKATVPVGSYKANDFGLYDMHGNVWEWVGDCYYSDYYGASKSSDTRKGSDDCTRVLRGGSWFVNADNLRASYRLWNAAETRIYSLGFRVARD